ncbi:MAG TPA: FG-GAP repeat protein, partial [Rhodanobacteraceae bacterium]|nr:FG-GAP repeat protein [Rhodanobacteraceae bacterium]
MKTRPLSSLVVCLSGCLAAAAAHAQSSSSAGDAAAPFGVPAWLSQTLLPDHTNSIDEFGSAVAIEGTVAMVGSPLYPQDQGGNGGQGIVYVYAYANGAWTEVQQLAPANVTPGAGFGSGIAIHGTTAVISAPTQNVDPYTLQGAVYVYTFADGQWSEAQELTKTNGGPYDNYFGESIAFDGDTIVIGETAAGANTGEPPGGGAYVFTLVAGQWTETASLYAADGETLDAFGRAVGVSGDEILVASPEAHWDANGAGPGSVHRFQRDGDTWTETELLQSDAPVAGEYFGEVVDVDGGIAAFGAPGATVGG